MRPFNFLNQILIVVLCVIVSIGCESEDDTVTNPVSESMYFPEIDSDQWETTSPESLSWNTDELSSLYSYLEDNKTRGFILLKNGRIVLEQYWGNDILNTRAFDVNTNWYWASAGKSLTATLVGIAQQEGLLSINDKTSDYLGNGWTNLAIEKENLISIKNQLTMTTGLDYVIDNLNCTDPSCLLYKQDAGNQWFYHNAPYTLLKDVVENASGESYNVFTSNRLGSTIGLSGSWRQTGDNNVYWSTARDMARFGLLILNEGNWSGNSILNDANYFTEMTTTSQDLNLSYGYLWWLNGKSQIIFPGIETAFNTSLSAEAPTDLISAMGKNGQFISIVPSENLVMIRIGEAPDDSLVPTIFHNELWAKINTIMMR
ncbi:serine hydrolase domain-containing protein [Spongiivirga citrea]|uniref:Serine hydrolase n=1 Tax=Spongiivirga citrea TaxID=1481457 RepID=A0A6M0CIZ9_9FLAO|nr:serine hydrolase [Spongiivirga citrea]NER17522.1 serine hydrolase [Spongiivirga citrea]